MTTFAPLFIPHELVFAVSDQAWLTAMIDAERALVRAEAKAGIIPEHGAERVVEFCRPDLYDIEQICRDARDAGNPAEPLVRAIREAVGPETSSCVHWGATSQDIIDTAAMLVAHRSLRMIQTWLGYAESNLDSLAEQHRATPMAGRTLIQQAVPTTFGVKVAGWLTGVREARAMIARVRDDRLTAQLGGAVGTLSVLGAQGPEVARLFAEELDLHQPVMPWHTNRIVLIEIGAALAAAAAASAKIATDIVLMAQTEVGELSEGSGGVSSTMPHKRNPTASILTLALAGRARAHCASLVAAEPHQHERAAGPWHIEWDTLSEALANAGGAVSAVTDALLTLQVNTDRMRANLDLSGGLILAERVAFAAAANAGLDEAHRLVALAAERSEEEDGVSFRQALADIPQLGLTLEQIDAQLDPTVGLEPAVALVDRVLKDEP